MPIVASRAREIHELLRRLGEEDEAQRESAVARLTLLGERATDALIKALPGASPVTRLGILAVLEASADRRGTASVIGQLDSSEPLVALRAVAAARALAEAGTAHALGRTAGRHPVAAVRTSALDALLRLAGGGRLDALDALLGLLFDEGAELSSRLAALPAVDQLSARDRRAVLEDLRAIPALAEPVAAMDQAAGPRRRRPPQAVRPAPVASLIAPLIAHPDDLRRALEIGRALGRLDASSEPQVRAALERTSHPLPLSVLLDALGRWRQPASIPALRQLLDRLTAAAAAGSDPAGVAEVKARIHLLLADLDSRIALYDLREMLEARPVLAGPSLLQAAVRLGEGSFVSALAALAHDVPEHLDGCRRAFAAIARRERLRRDSRVIRVVRPEHREALARLWKREAGR